MVGQAMLPKGNRVSTKEVETIFKKSAFLNSPSLTFRYFPPKADQPRAEKNLNKEAKISFIAPKSVAKQAVKRNLLRRRGYRALGKYIGLFPAGTIGVFIFKKYQEDILILENEIENILNKIN